MIALEPRDAARLVLGLMRRRDLGGAGSGNFGHVGRPGEVGGSASNTWTRFDDGDGWNQNAAGEKPYDWREDSTEYVVPEITHTVIRDNGTWGGSHGGSQMITGAAAEQMGIAGYSSKRLMYHDASQVKPIAERFLTAIASDTTGSEEVLHHAFENVRGTKFAVGDTMRLPLTASSGQPHTGYGKRADAADQIGQPTVFEFAKGTQMVAYGGWSLKDAKELGHKTRDDVIKEFREVWSEAIVAGGFKVTGVREEYFGSQHMSLGSGQVRRADFQTPQVYGKVVTLKQTETFDPVKGWKSRG